MLSSRPVYERTTDPYPFDRIEHGDRISAYGKDMWELSDSEAVFDPLPGTQFGFLPANPALIALRKDWESRLFIMPYYKSFWRNAAVMDLSQFGPVNAAHARRVCELMAVLEELDILGFRK